MDEYLIFKLFILVIHCGISFFLLWLVYKLFRKLLGLLNNPISGTKNSPLNLFLSFGVTIIFFNSIVLSSIYRIGKFFISPIEGFSIINSSFSNGSDLNSNLENDFANFIVEWAKRLELSFTNNILSLNFTGIIIFLTFWLLISLLFREIERSIKDENSEKKEERVKNFSENPTIKNMLTIGTLILSIYLCISSIVAVPEFQNLEATKIESNVNDNLAVELEAQRLYKKEDLLVSIDTAIKNAAKIKELDYIIERLTTTIGEYNNWVNINWAKDENAKNIAINRFKAAIDQKMGIKEKIDYKLTLTDWYVSFHQNWAFGASYYQSNLISLSKGVKEIFRDKDIVIMDTIYNVDSTFNLVAKMDNDTEKRLNNISADLLRFTSDLYLINTKYDIYSIPEKPQIGEKFGIFNTISGWLLRTESLSLALIVGLFGFGLLGSIGSTFIRQRLKDTKAGESDRPIVLYDIQGILINGISAAIVVFLAVKGALVIFSTGSDNMNPYILFFTCLVASVFSEDVWAWARKKLNDNLGKDNGGNKDQTEPVKK